MTKGDHVMTPAQQETILQLLSLGHTKASIARAVGVNKSTVYRFLKKQSPDELRESRREAMERIAGRITQHVEAQIDRLDPDEKMSYLQRMTGIGIGVDKMAVIDRRIQEHDDRDTGSGPGQLIPNSIEALVGAIRNDLRGGLLTLLQVRLDKDGDTLESSVRELETKMGVNLIEAEVTKLSDLDVGGHDAST